MNTFIISSKNITKALESVTNIINEEKVSKFDQDQLEFEKDLGITDIRHIQKNIFLKPYKGDKKSITLVLNKKATIEAQNALLKLLEEPPESTLIFIVSRNYHDFLPTILSRVKIIEIPDETKHSSVGVGEIENLSGAGDALYLAQNLAKDKANAINWLEDTIINMRINMLENIEDKKKALKYKQNIEKLEQAHLDLKNTNVNTRLALENLFLNIN